MSFGEFAIALYNNKGDRLSSCIVDLKNNYIESFMTEEKFRGNEFGELLLSYLIKYYDVNKLIVDKNNAVAIRLYEKLGFHFTGITRNTENNIYEYMELRS